MREFEKKFGIDHGVTTLTGGNYHNCIEYVWRAALEWVKQEAIRLNGEEGYHLIDVFKLTKVIEKELEEK
jgi:hypothetical protein